MNVKIKAKKIHEILEAFTFIFIAITCSILVLRTSINQENLSKASTDKTEFFNFQLGTTF